MFKEGYQKEMNEIKPRQAFLEDLAERMNEENEAVSKKKPVYMNWFYGTLAATFLICLVGGFSIFYFDSPNQDNVMDMQAGVSDTTKQSFETESIFGKASEPTEKYEILLEKIAVDEEVVILASDEDTFSEEDVMNSQATNRLISRLESATYQEDGQKKAENVMNYMVEFTDGTTVKFCIFDELYFYNEEIGSTFKLED